MSTRSNIAIYNRETGRIKKVYCHSDGYFEWNGAILLRYYNTPELAQALVDLGDLSCVYKRLSPIGLHTFDNSEEGVTIAYHRDRDEDLNFEDSYVGDFEIGNGKTIERILDQEYLYVYDLATKTWFGCSTRGFLSKLDENEYVLNSKYVD